MLKRRPVSSGFTCGEPGPTLRDLPPTPLIQAGAGWASSPGVTWLKGVEKFYDALTFEKYFFLLCTSNALKPVFNGLCTQTLPAWIRREGWEVSEGRAGFTVSESREDGTAFEHRSPPSPIPLAKQCVLSTRPEGHPSSVLE